MRYVKYLIDQVRRETENEDATDFVGIKDSEFLQYLNDAQHRLQSLITAHHPKVFIEETIMNIVSDQESYEFPSDIFLENKVHKVEYSSSGDEEDYYILEEGDYSVRSSGQSGSPVNYIRMSGKILLAPVPTSGKLRINYVKRIRELDLRRAEVKGNYCSDSGFTTQTTCEADGKTWTPNPTVSSSESWTIPLNTTNLTTDTTSLGEHDYVCIVDKEGKSIVKNIPLTSVASDLMTLEAHTVDSGTGETNTSILNAHYIVGSKDTTTHSDLPRNCERYLIAYCAWKILKRDSSTDSQEQQAELSAMEQDIVDSYKVITDDVQYVPQLNPWGDWFGEF